MKFNPIHRELVIPSSFAECFTYELQIAWLKKEIDNVATGGSGESVKVLEEKVAALEKSVAALKNKTNTLTTSVSDIKGKINSIKNDLDNVKRNLENFATKDDIAGFISEDRVNEKLVAYETIEHAEATFVKKGTTGDYVTVEQLDNKLVDYATKIELQEYVTDVQLEDYLTKTEANDTYAKKGEIPSDVLTKTEAVSTYATKEEIPNVSDFITETEADGKYATKESIVNFTTNDELNAYKEEVETNYAKKTELPDLTDYAKKSELPDLADYTTKSYVDTNFLSKNDFDGIIQNYAEKTELNKYVTTETAETTYAKKSEIPSDVLTKTEAASTYATKEEIPNVSDLATKQELTSGLNEKVSINTFDSVVATLATKENVEATYAKKTDIPDVSNLITDNELSQTLEEYATKTEIPEGVIVDATVSADGKNPVKSQGIYNFVVDQTSDLVTNEMLATKQDKLTFDETPTVGSVNPVKSSGIKTAIDTVTSDMLTKTEAVSTYATKSEIPSLDNYVTKNEIADMATMNGKLETITETIEANENITDGYLSTVTATFTLSHVPVGGYTINSEEIYEHYRFGASNVWYKKKSGTSSIEGNVITVVTSDENDGSVYVNPLKNKITVTYQYKSIGLNDCETKVHAEATYATKEELMNYSTQDDIDGIEQQLSNYATNISVSQALENKQDILTFDDMPISDSQNPVRSSGIKTAIETATTDMLTKTEADSIYLNKAESTQFVQRKRHILNNNVIDMTNTRLSLGTELSQRNENLSLLQVALEYDRDVYNENGMWFLDCNLIILFTTNASFELKYSGPKTSIYRTTTNQSKQMIEKQNDCSIEIFGVSAIGVEYCKYFPSTNGLPYNATNSNYFLNDANWIAFNDFTLAAGHTHYIKVTTAYKLVSSTPFTIDTAII